MIFSESADKRLLEKLMIALAVCIMQKPVNITAESPDFADKVCKVNRWSRFYLSTGNEITEKPFSGSIPNFV